MVCNNLGRLIRNQLQAITPCRGSGPGKAASHTLGSQQRSALADGAKEEVPKSEQEAESSPSSLRQPCLYRESQEFTDDTAETADSFLINLGSPPCGPR